ncbi:MAG: TonB-dependent receptor [Gemmatimonadetes bacterium]|nr:TonB-dependent receptor [Gemmatimonadota bacterium]
MFTPAFDPLRGCWRVRPRAVSMLRCAALVCLAVLVGSGLAAAQQGGTVSGRVVEARAGAPVETAQLYFVGTNLGTLSTAAGRFILLAVPPGEYELRAERIGFRTTSQRVTVRSGESQTVNFQLEPEVLGLDEIVVTGEAGGARRREVGHAISQINLSEIEEPAKDLETLLSARVPGVVITEASGNAGSGSFIRLRGINSVAMSNQPLLYIDGVRVRSEAYPKNVPPVGYSGRSANVQASPLADVNPEDIDRIEVIKGSAATALYGTEASAGVIQIFTKRGALRGRPRWTARIEQSIRHVTKHGAEGVDYIDNGKLMGNSDYLYMEPWLRDSWGQRYFLSVQGGLEDISYFLSGMWGDDQFPLPNDFEQTFALRGNLGFSVTGDLNLEWNSSFTKKHIQNTPSGDNAQGVVLNAWRPTTSYTGTVPSLKGNIDRLLEYDIDTFVDHFITAMTARYTPSDKLDQRFTIGFDRTFNEGRQLRPFGFILQPNGILSNKRWVNETLTLDYAGSYTTPLGSDLGLTVSLGGQVVETDESSTTGYAENFPGPGDPTLSSGAVSLSFEDRIRVINAGFFVQNRVSYRDRLFVTAGLRVDGNSAFGEGLGLQPYPKFSVSYVLSEEPFWNPGWGSLKLRFAYGQAGRAPGAFDAVRTWRPVKLSGQSAFVPQNLGNPELGPERTEEFEGGLTGSFLSDRLSADLTYYHQRTSDALFPVRTPPSDGGWADQLRNVGKLRNQGIELALNGSVIARENLGWDLGLLVYTNHSKVLDLGGAPEFSVGGFGFIVRGQPVPVLRSPRVTNPDEIADPKYDLAYYWGPTQPTLTVTPSTEIRLPRGVTVSARGEYLGGHYIQDANTYGQISRGEALWPSCIRIQELFKAGRLNELTAYQRNRCVQKYSRNGTPVNKGDFFKLREVTVRIPLWFWTNVTSPSLTISGRNVWKWLNDDWWVLDPEIGCNTGHNCLVISQQEHIPPPATYTVALRFGF